MKNILFYGDSNTWGYNPETDGRFPFTVRFTGRLASAFPEDRMLEAGLNGRNTAYDDDLEPWRNGAAFLPATLKTQDPLDLVVFMLGTNDLKFRYNRSVEEITDGMAQLVRIVQDHTLWHARSNPEILLLAPPPLRAEGIALSRMSNQFDNSSVERSKMLAKSYADLAAAYRCHFLDAGQIGEMGSLDGVHMSAQNHADLAKCLTARLRMLWNA